jgi:hypothetical protein
MKLISISITVVTCDGNFLGQRSIKFPLDDHFNFVNAKALESA